MRDSHAGTHPFFERRENTRTVCYSGRHLRPVDDEVATAFSSWFGQAEDFELIDATVGEVGGRLHLSWRLRLRPAPFEIGDGWHVIEQQAYADAGDTIESLDLLCSGFHPERITEHSVSQ